MRYSRRFKIVVVLVFIAVLLIVRGCLGGFSEKSKHESPRQFEDAGLDIDGGIGVGVGTGTGVGVGTEEVMLSETGEASRAGGATGADGVIEAEGTVGVDGADGAIIDKLSEECGPDPESPNCIAAHDKLFLARRLSGPHVSYEQLGAFAGAELVRGKSDSKLISWTFDAGDKGDTFTQTMDVLRERDIRTTVFVTGEWVEEYPDYFKRLLQDGHEIGNHSYDHPDFTKLNRHQLKEQLQRTERAVKEASGIDLKPLFRYPYGSRNEWTNDFIQRNGYKSIFWSVDTVDWRDGSERVRAVVLEKAKGGDIILSHLGNASTGPVLAELIDLLMGRGYKFVTISELVLASQK